MTTLLLVHAHPDDEAISTGGVMARARAAGHRVVLVTCTRGEEGEIHNMDEASVRPRLAEVRTEELRRAGELLGVDRQAFLGYRDSGMAGTASNQHPESFHQATLGAAAERLAAIVREERPEVVVTYTADGTYGHPDHVRAHHVTIAALDLLEREGWRPAKLYLHGIPRSQLERMRSEAAGQDVDASEIQLIGTPDEEITTVVDVRDLADLKRRAFAAHVSQNDPAGVLHTMAAQVFEAAFGTEHFVLARGARGEQEPETSLWEGVGGDR